MKKIIEISKSNVRENFQIIKKEVGKNVKIIGMIKADAYGHGAVEIAKTLDSDIDMFGVAFVEEAIELKEAKIKTPILILPYTDYKDIDKILENNFIQVVDKIKFAEELSLKAYKKGKIANIFVKVDTGMGRCGFIWEEANKYINQIIEMKNLKVIGIMSHFASSDSDIHFSNEQIKRFEKVIKSVNIKNLQNSIANSGAILNLKKSYYEMVRPGLFLYGLKHSTKEIRLKLKPALKFISEIVNIKKVKKNTPIGYDSTFKTKRDSIIGIVPVGYGDGYSRLLSNCGEVIINKKKVPILGRVSMDSIVVDLTNIKNVKEQSKVILIGKDGEAVITAEDIAEKTKTISYEVTCNLGKRIKRIYYE